MESSSFCVKKSNVPQTPGKFGFEAKAVPVLCSVASKILPAIVMDCTSTEEDAELQDAQQDSTSDDSLDSEEEFRLHLREFAQSHGCQTAKALFAIEIRKLEKKEKKEPATKKRKL